MKSFNKSNSLDTIINIPDDTEFIQIINCPKVKFLSFPESTKIIECVNCKRLDNITLPKNTESIYFKNCFSIQHIILNQGLLRISTECFIGCYNLKSIIIPDSVVEFGINDIIYSCDEENCGCFEKSTTVIFASDLKTNINLLTEDEKIKRQMRKKELISSIINENKNVECDTEIYDIKNPSWYNDECYQIYRKKHISTFAKINYENEIKKIKMKEQERQERINKIKESSKKSDDSDEQFNW